MKLPEEFKRLWIEALHSGKYQQAYGKLRRNDGFCCLGVACDIYNHDQWRATSADYWLTNSRGGSSPGAGDIPTDALAVLEYGNDGSAMTTLIHLNDIVRQTFPQIANWIECNL